MMNHFSDTADITWPTKTEQTKHEYFISGQHLPC
uniref:Uncharacterized protein n=1 Tax=Anguilla anguilla TaxID=7936 RepID=A0A0E9VLB0_ANGAN